MDFVYQLIVVTHLLGMAAVVGGYATAQPVVSDAMVWGARMQVVTGFILFGMAEYLSALDKDLSMAKIGVKLTIAVVVAACAEMGYADAKRGRQVPWMTHVAGGLAIVNVLVAVLWT